MSLDWRELDVPCRGKTYLFFTELGEDTAPAQRICKKCHVQRECLDYALDNNEVHGVWGGMSGNQRRMVKSIRRRARIGKLSPKLAAELEENLVNRVA